MAAHFPKLAIPVRHPSDGFGLRYIHGLYCSLLSSASQAQQTFACGPVTCAHSLAGLLLEPEPVPCKHCTSPTVKCLSALRSHNLLCRQKHPFLAELLWLLQFRMVPEILSIKAFSSGALCRHVRWTAFSRGAGLTTELGEAVLTASGGASSRYGAGSSPGTVG